MSSSTEAAVASPALAIVAAVSRDLELYGVLSRLSRLIQAEMHEKRVAEGLLASALLGNCDRCAGSVPSPPLACPVLWGRQGEEADDQFSSFFQEMGIDATRCDFKGRSTTAFCDCAARSALARATQGGTDVDRATERLVSVLLSSETQTKMNGLLDSATSHPAAHDAKSMLDHLRCRFLPSKQQGPTWRVLVSGLDQPVGNALDAVRLRCGDYIKGSQFVRRGFVLKRDEFWAEFAPAAAIPDDVNDADFAALVWCTDADKHGEDAQALQSLWQRVGNDAPTLVVLPHLSSTRASGLIDDVFNHLRLQAKTIANLSSIQLVHALGISALSPMPQAWAILEQHDQRALGEARRLELVFHFIHDMSPAAT
jgi:hypothetical protein